MAHAGFRKIFEEGSREAILICPETTNLQAPRQPFMKAILSVLLQPTSVGAI